MDSSFSTIRKEIIVFMLVLLLSVNLLNGQQSVYSYYYRVSFRDKGENAINNFHAEDLLSQKAIKRREKAGITVPDYKDIPVSQNYLNNISSLGFKLHCTSKWMNSAVFKTQSSADIATLLSLSFVSDVRVVKTPGIKSRFTDKLDFSVVQTNISSFERQIEMVNGNPLHNSGYNGKGVLIAVLDGGFLNADKISSLKDLRARNGIKATYNFVSDNSFVYNFSTHGTAVLSVLSGHLAGLVEGTAPGADYLLLKTEDVESEYPVEEDFWAAGAEYADSAGADIISSSLGYYNFDNPDFNYKYTDLDGNSAFVTKVADIASSKGILVVNSAGNERTKAWKRIIFPSDGDSVLAAGAVDANNLISTFSSAGPSADGRIKPDNAAMSVSVTVQAETYVIAQANGTSFSCPVLSGMAACLIQAVPLAKNTDIISAFHSSADRYNSPDSLYGYGIPDMVIALKILQDSFVKIPFEESVAGPNPTFGSIEIIFKEPPESMSVEIVSMSGKRIYRKDFRDFAGRTLEITELQNMDPGVYFIRIIKVSGTDVHKIIKLRN